MNPSRKIVLNTSFQLLARLGSTLLTFTITYLTIRLAGEGLYGDLAKVTSLLGVCYTALDFGINALVVRELGLNQQKNRALLSTTLLLRLFLALLTGLLTLFVIYLLPGSETQGYTSSVRTAYLLGLPSIFFYAVHLTTNASFQKELRYDKVAASSLLGAATMFITSYLFLRTSPSPETLALAVTLGYFVTAALSLYFAKSRLSLESSLAQVLPLARRAIPIGVVLLLSMLAGKVDIIILGALRSSEEVGQYGFAYKIFDFALTLPVFAMNAVYPFLLTKTAAAVIRRTLPSLILLGALAGASLFLLSPLILLVKPTLTLSLTTLRILSLSLPLFYASAPLMWGLIAKRKELSLIKIYFLGACINILGNLLAVPTYGAQASAFLTIATEGAILIGLLHARKS